MTRVLVSPASYILTDYLISSEGISCYNLFKSMSKYNYFFEAISAYVRVKKLLKNVNFHQTGSFEIMPSTTLLKRYIGYAEFITRSYLKSSKILRNKNIDIIHHMFPAVYNQSFNILALLGKTRRKPFVFGPISAHLHPRPPDERMLMKISSKLHMRTIQMSDIVIAITQEVGELYSRIVDEDKIWVIPLGVDIEMFKPLERQRRRLNFEILFAGFLYKLKGVEYLLRAIPTVIKEYPNIKLRIIGEGPEKGNLIKLAEKLEIRDKVIFQGFVPHVEIARYYQNCDIFCFPTLGEPFGKAILEAMACGKPVIASNIGGPSRLIEDGKTGFLVPPKKPGAIAEKILSLVSDFSKLRRMGMKARRVILEKYSWNRIASLYHKLYSSLL